MTISTVSVGAAVTPTVIETWCTHYLNRRPRRHKPTAHISYDVGLHLIRQFLAYAAKETVEDIQAFTRQWVPSPRWVRTEGVDIPESFLTDAATHINNDLGPDGIRLVGGRSWWQWRQADNQLKAEWVEMRRDYTNRKQRNSECTRVMLYVHGGAYYFGSVDEHRYQMQRHARKLQARVFAPRYRLAPQFPFPCGLQDCLAAYLFLLTVQKPETIILAGDSAGGGMVVSLMCVLRDQGLPMPAGAILLSPWVDLTHSFPSVAGMNQLDYVPPHGFMHKPSMSWPPPNSDDLQSLDSAIVEGADGKSMTAKELRQRASSWQGGKGKQNANNLPEMGVSVSDATQQDLQNRQLNALPGIPENLSVVIDGKSIEIKDQIQMYAPNHLLSHPLVSPVLQPTLGGLPPTCILVGGGEMLRDEQIYLAHKMANPAAYPPPSTADMVQGSAAGNSPEAHVGTALSDPDRIVGLISQYPPTYVQLQVWDDLCHVAPTLSFTRPAKYMYRSVAQFGAWCLARAQRSEVRIMNDDEVSLISTSSDGDDDDEFDETNSTRTGSRADAKAKPTEPTTGQPEQRPTRQDTAASTAKKRSRTPGKAVGRAGDPLPLFQNRMIRQRVTRHGDIYALEPQAELAACTMAKTDIGTIKEGPVRKWLAAQEGAVQKFGDLKKQLQTKRIREMTEANGGVDAVFTQGRERTMVFGEERPPATALANRTKAQLKAMGMDKKPKGKISRGLSMWSGWGSKHDEEAIEKEEEKVKNKEDVTVSVTNVRIKRSPSMDVLSGMGGVGVAGSSSNAAAVPSTSKEAVKPTDGTFLEPKSANVSQQNLNGNPNRQTTYTDDAAIAAPAMALAGSSATPLPVTNGSTAANKPVNAVPSRLALDSPNRLSYAEAGPTIPESATLPSFPHRRNPSRFDPDEPVPPIPAYLLQPNGVTEERPGTAASNALDTEDGHVETGQQAVAVTMLTPDAARKEHARASSRYGDGMDRIIGLNNESVTPTESEGAGELAAADAGSERPTVERFVTAKQL